MKILGMDIGGSGIKAAIVDTKTGELISDRHRIATPNPATPQAVAQVVKEMINHFNWEKAVGCSFPTTIIDGKCIHSGNLNEKWKNVQVDDYFKDACNVPFYISNDADLAGLAEITLGAGKRKKGLVLVITIGTGIGSALFIDGKLVTNTEFGHVYMQGHKKIAEKYASNAAREREDLKWKAWAARYNEYLNFINSICYPDLFILGGGISKHFKKYGEYFDLKDKIVPAELKNFAGIVGAALYADSQL